MKLAYLVNTYPKPSHSFIRREIQALERQGFEVRRFAIRGDRAALVDPADIAEMRADRAGAGAGRRRGSRSRCWARRCARPAASLAALRLALACGRRAPGGTLRSISPISPRPAISRGGCARSGSSICTRISAPTPPPWRCWPGALGGLALELHRPRAGGVRRAGGAGARREDPARRLHRGGQLVRAQPAVPLGRLAVWPRHPCRALRDRARAFPRAGADAGRATRGWSRSGASSSRRASCC